MKIGIDSLRINSFSPQPPPPTPLSFMVSDRMSKCEISWTPHLFICAIEFEVPHV